MNWQNYKFFTICGDGIDSYHHFIWVDNEVFSFEKYSKKFIRILSKEENFIYHEEYFFPLRNEHSNYIIAKKYWNYLEIPNHINDYTEVSDHLKKLMKRELSLEKILNTI